MAVIMKTAGFPYRRWGHAGSQATEENTIPAAICRK